LGNQYISRNCKCQCTVA